MKSKAGYTRQEADEIIELIKQKLNADSTKQKGIRAKIKNRGFHASDFGFRGGYTVADFLSVAKIKGGTVNVKSSIIPYKEKATAKPKARKDSDENYVIDLCDKILSQKAIRQHKFDFLRGDAGTMLPVDAYYESLNLVIEYRERQHTEPVKLLDKRQTVSGISRGEQRNIYDQRRRDVFPKHGIKLIEISFDDFEYDSGKRIIRDGVRDEKKVRLMLKLSCAEYLVTV